MKGAPDFFWKRSEELRDAVESEESEERVDASPDSSSSGDESSSSSGSQ